MFSATIRLSLAGFFAGALVSGCAVGPDFRPPSPPAVKTFTSVPARTAAAPGAAGGAQTFLPGGDIPAQWWKVFRSEPLDMLIRQAMTDSPSIASSQAALRAALENRRAKIGSFFPSIDAGFSANRKAYSGASVGAPGSSGGTFTLYNASVNVSYTLDLFGANRRGLEELQAQADYQRYLLEGSYLTLTANIVTTAVQEASLRARIAATNEILAAEKQQLDLVDRRFQLGGGSRSDILAQEAQLAQTRATLPPLEKELAQVRHQLALLMGRTPVEAASLPQFQLTDIQLPAELPVSLPSTLARQRPDIRSSEELLHAASARLGIATANLYPQLTVTGSFGSESTPLTSLFSPGTAAWNIGAGLLQPIFRGGELTAKRRAAVAAYEQAEAQYRQTVLQALREVADVLQALNHDAANLKAQVEAETAARDSLDLTRRQYEFGSVSYLSLLNAERQFQQARIAVAQARAARLADTAALFQALGGGWWNGNL
jgi:NodT family efflux transporter outer membrane factor (OMF) lipoprotein